MFMGAGTGALITSTSRDLNFAYTKQNFDGDQDKRPRADGTVPSFRSDRKTTVGVEFATMVVTHPDGKRIKAQIWDTGEGLWVLRYETAV